MRRLALTVTTLVACGAAGTAQASDLLGVPCASSVPTRCEGAACVPALADRGNATEPASGRRFFLDYPCGLKANEKVVVILNLHGGGSIGNWQRHYFPASDYKEKYRIVVATPTAATEAVMVPGRPAARRWEASADDAHLQAVTEQIISGIGRKNVKAFWLAGHSQGGMTSRRIVCSPYFRDKVDGFLSLSGGRLGVAPTVARFGPPLADKSPPPPRQLPAALLNAPLPECSFSHIFAIGEHEVTGVPATSPWAERYGCKARRQKRDIVDTAPGHVWDFARAGYPVWGMQAGPGTARVATFPGCEDGVVVADVVRVGKGHTEGLEPRVTEALVRMIVAAPGGKIAKGG